MWSLPPSDKLLLFSALHLAVFKFDALKVFFSFLRDDLKLLYSA